MLKKLLLALVLPACTHAATFFSCATGNSNAPGTWSATLGGSCGAGVPGSADTANVSHAVTVNANLTVAALNLNGSGKVTTSAGITLHSTGVYALNPTDSTVTCQITLAAGSTLQVDTKIHGIAAYNYSPICATGTSGSHVVISGGTTHGYLTCDGYGCGITGTYIDFQNFGGATQKLALVWTSPSFPTGNDWNVTFSTFTGSGGIDYMDASGGMPDGMSWIHEHNVHTGTLGSGAQAGFTMRTASVPGASFTTGTRSIKFNVFDKQFGIDDAANYGSVKGFAIEDNYFGGGFASAGAAASWARNFARTSTDERATTAAIDGMLSQSSMSNSYTLIDEQSLHHTHGVDILLGAGNVTLDGLIFDTTFPSSTAFGSDGVVSYATGGQSTTITHTLSLMGQDGIGVGTLTDLISALSNTVTADHNTAVASAYSMFQYENETSTVATRGTITNNILYGASTGPYLRLFTWDSHASIANGVSATTDIWAPTSIHHNGLFQNTATDTDPDVASIFVNQANGCAGAWSATPNATGLVTANPNFVDPARTFAMFDHDYLGNTAASWATATNYTAGDMVQVVGGYNGRTVTLRALTTHNSSTANSQPLVGSAWHQYWEFATLYRIRTAVAAGTTITDSSLGLTGASYITAVIAWVRAGFAPTNSAYHSTASDGTDVGAVAYAGGAAVPVTSNIRVDDVTSDGGHSSVRFTWDSDLAPGPPVFQQVQYGPDTSYGSLLTVYGGSAGLMNQQMIVSGNAPGSTVHFCPQTCSSAGCSSCVGKDQVVTFPAAPAVHPALPAAPSVTAQPYPSSTAGWSVATAASDCHDLQSLVDAASTHSNAFPGYIVKIPVGSCPPGTVLVIRPVSEGAGGVQLINPYTNMSTVDGTITMTGHGFTLNQTVYIDARLDGAPPGGFSVPPTQYYVVNPTANTFQLSATPSGSAIVPTTTGSDVWISPTVVPNRVPIIIRSAAPDSATPKPGVRFDPAGYAGCLAVLQTNDPDISTVKLEPFTHDVHFGPCIEVTQAPQFASGLNLFDQHLQTAPLWDQGNRQNFNYISLDRVWIHGPGCPDRTKYGLKFDGANVQLDSSVIDNIAACRPNYSGFAASKSGSTINVAAGTYYFLLSSNAASASSVTVSGSGTGTIFVTLAPGTAVPKFYLPAGISGVCSGCTIVSSTLFDFPRDGFGHLSEGPIASISVSSGVLGVAANAIDVFGGVNFVGDLPFGSNAEGGEAIDVVSGPGPMMFTNNFFHNNRGITLFIEDTGATYGFNLSDFYIARNTFAIDDTFNPASGTWNHLNSLNRHQMEVKTGHKIMATGNVFSGQFGYGQPSAMAMLLASNNAVGATPPVSIGMSDLTATYNTIHDSAGGIGVNGGPPGGNFPHIARRVLVANNLLYNINAWQHTAVAPSVQYSVPGWAFYLGFGGEDWTLDHNTVANVFGPNASWVYWIHDKQEGVAIRNNVAVNVGEDKPNHMFVVEGSGGTTPQCWFDVGKAAMDCSLTPNYSFINNALGAGFTNSQAQTGNSSATMAGAYTSVDASNTVLSQSTVAARIAAMGWRAMASGDFRFNVASTFAGNTHPAADGYPVGADLDAIDRAQGHISNLRSLLITSSGATIYFQAPDAGAACYAKVVPSGASDLTTASTFGPDTAQSLLRSIALTGLSTATAYDAYAMCSGATNAPSVTFTTH